jgi:hypothetical protein
VHASRLQFYSDKDLNVTIRLQEQIQHDEWNFTVESFKDFRKEGKQYQVLTQWLGIDEPVREPMDIYHVPRCSQAFTSLPGLSRPAYRSQMKVSVSMGVTAAMCVTSISPHSQVVFETSASAAEGLCCLPATYRALPANSVTRTLSDLEGSHGSCPCLLSKREVCPFCVPRRPTWIYGHEERCDVVVIVHHPSSWPRVTSTRSG